MDSKALNVHYTFRIGADFPRRNLYASGMGQRSLEAFLEDAFGRIQPTSTTIGRVMVDPNYATTADDTDLGRLADELVHCIREHTPHPTALRSPQGHDISIPANHPLLKKYLHKITLYQDAGIGSWVQVAPPGSFV
jgi:hypothetical protein